MPQIVTIGELNEDDLENIMFNDESGQVIYTGTRSDLTYFDITLDLSETNSVIQFFVTDTDMDNQYVDSEDDGLYLAKDSDTSIKTGMVQEPGESEYMNLFMFKFWSGINGTHTFKVRDGGSYNYRHSKHIVLVLKSV